jgi:hypothetical protein
VNYGGHGVREWVNGHSMYSMVGQSQNFGLDSEGDGESCEGSE